MYLVSSLAPRRHKARTCIVILASLFLAGSRQVFATTPSLTVLHAFSASTAGGPNGSLVLGSDGAYYGTTGYGGTGYTDGLSGQGAVIKVTTDGTTTILHAFSGSDGSHPYGGLLLASDGNFYGTTGFGGAGYVDDLNQAFGTVFKITLSGTLTTLHSFTGTDGFKPNGRLVQASDGTIYGTTAAGGPDYSSTQDGYGTVFKITTSGTFTSQHSFSATDGAMPYAGLSLDGSGNLYGVCAAGGASHTGMDAFNHPNGYGTVFKITSDATFSTLHSFTGTDGACPRGELVLGDDGKYYGTTVYGGTNFSSDNASSFLNGYGTVYKVTTGGAVTTVHSFSGSDGLTPYAALVKDANGDFYGTTNAGGSTYIDAYTGRGTIFKLVSDGTLTTLHSFTTEESAMPFGAVVLDADGNLFGTTQGVGDAGSFFKLIP